MKLPMNTTGEARPIIEQLSLEYVLPKEASSALPLVQKLCRGLADENIIYCHWKSNNAIERSASGENDLDLLVRRADGQRFSELLHRLGFKQAKAPIEKQLPGVLDYYGFDGEADRLIHVHAHFQLILGHDMTKNYRLPIEEPYLESAVRCEVFKIPAPEFEFIVFVIRMIIKHSTWDVILSREGALNRAEHSELQFLHEQIEMERVYNILKLHLPYVDVELFDHCVQALRPGRSTWSRIKTGWQLQARLQAHACRSSIKDTYLKFRNRSVLALRRRLSKTVAKRQLQSGGAAIAIVGGDGAGKSTAVEGLYGWLSKDFDVRKMHLGKPAWSKTTIFIRAILKIGQILGLYPLEATFQETIEQKSIVSPGYPFLLREVCRARDRHQTYLKARRFAANGGLVIFDRFPLHQIQLMDGPQVERFIRLNREGPGANSFLSPCQDSRAAKLLAKIEKSYYRQIVLPELLIVLRVDPEIAVQRRIGEQVTSVRARSTEIMEVDWQSTKAHIINSGKSKTDVMAELKALIWSEL